MCYQPLGHFPCFGGLLVFGGGAAAGAHDQGVGILFSAFEQHVQPFYQLVLHGAIGIQLEAQRHQAQFIRIRQAVGKHVRMHRQVVVDRRPQTHDAFPLCRGIGVHLIQLDHQAVVLQFRFLAVRAEIHHHFLDEVLGGRQLGPGFFIHDVNLRF